MNTGVPFAESTLAHSPFAQATIAHPTSAGPRTTTLALLVLLTGSAATIAAPAPVLVRSLFALPVLTLVAGYSAATLVLGSGLRAELGRDRRHHNLRLLLTPVFSTVALLASALVLEALAIPLSTRALLGVLAAIALALMLCARWRTLRGPWSGAVRGTARLPVVGQRLGGAVAVTSALLVLAAAVAGAVALQSGPTDRYVLLDLERQAGSRPGPLVVHAGKDVVLNWTMNSYGFALPDSNPVVSIAVGGARPADATVQSSAPLPTAGSDTGATSRQSGFVAFPAPARAGLYRVELTVAPRHRASSEEPGSALQLTMQVEP